jgi:hypothetical protein
LTCHRAYPGLYLHNKPAGPPGPGPIIGQGADTNEAQDLAQQSHLDLSILHGDGSNTVAKKGGDDIGYSGHKHQKGEKVLAIVDNNGFVLAPLPVAPVNEADTVLLPDGLNALKRVARLTDLKIDGSYLNLDGGFDSRHNRKAIFNAGLFQTSKKTRAIENPEARAKAVVQCRRPFVTVMRGTYLRVGRQIQAVAVTL